VLGLAAAFLAGWAAMVASQVGDADYVPFFIGLSFLGGIVAWTGREPAASLHRTIAGWTAAIWLVAAAWVGVLLLWALADGGGSGPPPGPPKTYLALPVTVYYLVGLYGGAALVTWSVFGRSIRGRGRPVAKPGPANTD
jgi:hypothetical protein